MPTSRPRLLRVARFLLAIIGLVVCATGCELVGVSTIEEVAAPTIVPTEPTEPSVPTEPTGTEKSVTGAGETPVGLPTPVAPPTPAAPAPAEGGGADRDDDPAECAAVFDDNLDVPAASVRRELADCRRDLCEEVAGGTICFYTTNDDPRRQRFLDVARPASRAALTTFTSWGPAIGHVNVLLNDNPRAFGEGRTTEAIATGAGAGRPCEVRVWTWDDDAELSFLMAHELFHCLGYWGHLGPAATFEQQVSWAGEAGAEWAAVAVVGSSSPAHPVGSLNESWASNDDSAYGAWPFWSWYASLTGPVETVAALGAFGDDLSAERARWRSLEAAGGPRFHAFVRALAAGEVPHASAAAVTHSGDASIDAPFEVERDERMAFEAWRVAVTIRDDARYRFGDASADADTAVLQAGAWHGNGHEFDACEGDVVTIIVSATAEQSALDFGVDAVGEAISCAPAPDAAADAEPAPAPSTGTCPSGTYQVESGSLRAAYQAILGQAGLASNFESAVVNPSGGILQLVVDGERVDLVFVDFTIAMTVTLPGSDPFEGVATVNGGGSGRLSGDTLTIEGGSVTTNVALASDFGPINQTVPSSVSGTWPATCTGTAIEIGDAVGGSQPAVFLPS